MAFREQLRNMGACQESLDWVGNKTLDQAWKTCRNSQWMLWILSQTNLDLIDPVCDMAEEVLHLVPEKCKPACSNAISAARRRTNKDELTAVYDTITATAGDYVDYINDAVCRCTIRAVCDASNASYYASYDAAVARAAVARTASEAADAAGYAATRSAFHTVAARSAYYAAKMKEQKKQCDILREHFTIDQVREAFNKLVA